MSNPVWRKRALVVASGVAVGALALAGCTPSAPAPGESSANASAIIAEVNELTSFNPNTSQGNIDINSKISYLTRSGFFYIDDKLNVVPDTSFGKMEKISDDPLTVEYTLNEGLTWSDGDAIDTDDLLFGWAAMSGYFDDYTLGDDGKIASGTQLFDVAGSTAGVNTTEVPVVSDDKLSLTLTYGTPFVDWNLLQLIDEPVHVVADKAGVTVEELITAITTTPKGDAAAPVTPNPTIKAAADFWNTGFDVTSLPDDPSLFLSSGAFIVDEWAPTQSVTLKRNDKYTGDLKPAYDEMVVRFIGDSNAQVTALQNGEVDVINPQASEATLETLEGLSGIQVLQGAQLAYDHVDLKFDGVFADAAVREAFLKTIPRERILASLITPINPEAQVLNSQVYVTSEGKVYDESAAQNTSDRFAKVDIEGAKALLKGATPTVRVLFSSVNPNRVAAFEAIQASASEAGFVVENVGREDWGSQLGSDIYDAAIFGWISPGVGNAALPQIFAAGGGGNYNGYSNPRATELANESQFVTNDDELNKIKFEIDRLAFEDNYGLPLFQSPGLIAHTDRVSGVTYMANQTGPIWNFWEWTVGE
ncbi:MAG TPA: ABC transporter family substrate-binding protein [Microbacteriaceae bacterium]|nr:ABC transporter family substrate-binding protein [Microbacteriaceae bacterium]